MLPVPSPHTLILTRRDIAQLMTLDDWLSAATVAFSALATGRAKSPAPMHVPAHGGGFHAKGASLDGERPLVAVKLNGNFPGNPAKHDLPTIQGAILLADAANGSLLTIMDSIEVTLRRTAAASALAARHLANPNSARIAICGCGEQGWVQLEAMAAIFALKDIAVWDRDTDRSRAFATHAHETFHIPTTAHGSIESATITADIVVTCTTARSPFLGPQHMRKGAFIAAVGADNPDKSEIAPELMARAKIVVDVLDQCLVMGDLHHAVASGLVAPSDVHAELGQIVAGQAAGRTGPDEIIVFDSTGTAAQDVAAAAEVYARAIERGIGMRIALGAA